MRNFLFGVLLTVAYYNQSTIIRAYHKVVYEFYVAKQAVQNTNASSSNAPALDTSVDVVEPSLPSMARLGFKTREG